MNWVFATLPVTDYQDAQHLQHRIVSARTDGHLDANVVLWLEHHPVFTLGRHGGAENLTVSRDLLDTLQIPVIPSERGGNITFHGPGQLVVYPIVHLQKAGLRVPAYVHLLEEVMIETARDIGVTAFRSSVNPGVYVDSRKLGSVGIAIRHGITFHGFALNSDLSLEPFQWIHPCGLKNTEVTSLATETASPVSLDAVQAAAQNHFCRLFGASPVRIERDELEGMVTNG